MQHTLGEMLHWFGLHNSPEEISMHCQSHNWETGSNHYCYKGKNNKNQNKPEDDTQHWEELFTVFQAKFLQSDPCLPLGQQIIHKISVKFTAMDNVSCHSCIYPSTDEADESSHSKQVFGLILSGKSCIGDISVKESVELKCFCSVCGQKPSELSLSHDDDDALSVPAVTLENITQQLLKLVLNQQVKVTFIQRVFKSHYKYWFSASLGTLEEHQDLLAPLLPVLNQQYSPSNHGSKTPVQSQWQACTLLPKLPSKNLMEYSRSWSNSNPQQRNKWLIMSNALLKEDWSNTSQNRP